MADKVQNPILNRKRQEFRRNEQLLSLSRYELRVMELEDEISKTQEAIGNTKRIIGEIEQEMEADGVKF